MIDFKLRMYFEMYKDLPLPNREKFRYNFKKKHGKYQYLEELIKKIEKHQIKKYGTTLSNFIRVKTREESKKIHKKANAREKRMIKKRVMKNV